jgi:hypothetical protein
LTGFLGIVSVGNVLPSTVETFGGDAQYGTPDVARFGGTLTSAVLPIRSSPGSARTSPLMMR